VLQDSLFIVARRLRSLRDPQWFRAWAYRITTREAFRRSRADKRWELIDEDAMAVLLNQHAEDDSGEAPLISMHHLEQLSPAAQVVLRLHYLDDLTLAEISEALEVSVGTVKSRLAYGLAALRKLIPAPH
jgi:RNA polymerase sigma-70 factor (ECF subfamily)